MPHRVRPASAPPALPASSYLAPPNSLNDAHTSPPSSPSSSNAQEHPAIEAELNYLVAVLDSNSHYGSSSSSSVPATPTPPTPSLSAASSPQSPTPAQFSPSAVVHSPPPFDLPSAKFARR